jgi:predicted AAA+ superfamily ATPase
MKSWRDIAVPHRDVLQGAFKQAEFAADISAVHDGRATDEYQNPIAFFDRTHITEGMRLLLTQVAERLAGRGGEPVIQLQTAFGGGKTHTMLAVLHLASRECELSELTGIPTLVERAGLMDVPKATVAVLDGNAHPPGQPWEREGRVVKTLWGDLAWQLGKSEGLAMVQEADATGTSPGKDLLRRLLEKYAPCVVLIDELVAYVRQFPEGQTLSGGTYDSNLSFIQALTEAVKLVPTAVVLASLPESEVEAGSNRGVATLKALEKTFGRVQALWKPIATEEAFEIVRRRLFVPIKDESARDSVCRAFADAYVAEGAKLPSETQEGRYLDRLIQAYPIHPEVFDRLYEDWATIEGFQRTRGVLKLMAKVIARLWRDGNSDLLILPSSLPLDDGDVRTEMTYLLNSGWDPVIEGDIDGPRAETVELEAREHRFGPTQAARRVARTLFLGTAPSSVATRPGVRGLDRGRVLLGCLQPGQTSSLYTDALKRLADRLHYLNCSGDKEAEGARFWFDTRANLRREMEDRKRRFDSRSDIGKRIEEELKKLFPTTGLLEGVHVFTPHDDIPDDSALRLVVLPLDCWHTREDSRRAQTAVLEHLKSHGPQPRHRANRLLFVAPDQAVIARLEEVTRVALAWASIVSDVNARRLNIDQNQLRQAEEEAKAAAAVVPRAARECFKWLLCPVLDDPTSSAPGIEPFALNTSGGDSIGEIERICKENALVITTWSPIHLRDTLKQLYWRGEKTSVSAGQFWEDSLRYLYLPRLAKREVLAAAIRIGVDSRDFFGTAYGEVDGKYEGFQLGGGGVSFDDTLLLIEPSHAASYEEAHRPQPIAPQLPLERRGATVDVASPSVSEGASPLAPAYVQSAAPTAASFYATVVVTPSTAKVRLVQLADEVVSLLSSDPNAELRVTLEVHADFPLGISDQLKRSVDENCTSLGVEDKGWE